MENLTLFPGLLRRIASKSRVPLTISEAVLARYSVFNNHLFDFSTFKNSI